MASRGAGSEAGNIRLDDIVRRNERIVHADLGDSVVTLDLEAGRYSELDPVAKRVWELIAETPSVAELRDALVAEYAVDPSTCLDDLLPFVRTLAELDIVLIEPAGAKRTS